MRRGATLLVVVAISAIAMAAGWDALRGGDEPAAQPEAQPREQPDGDEETNYVPLKPAEPDPVRGVLYYTGEDCELRAAELPDLRPSDAPNWGDCRFTLSPDGTRVGDESTAWDPHADPRRGRLFQVEGDTIQVATNAGPEGDPIRGTAPAWRPDGTLTYFADGEIRDWPGGNTIVHAPRIRMVVLDHPNAPGGQELLGDVQVLEHRWLSQDRLVAVLGASVQGGGPSLRLVAVFDEGLPHATTNFLELAEGLTVSPHGTYYAVNADGIRAYTRDGDEVFLPEMTGSRAVAWSPDEAVMAVATEASVYVFAPGETDRVERLEIVANDLDWRGPAQPETLADAGDARAWLGPMGVSGRLVVSVPGEDGCTIHALQMPDLNWSGRPAAVPGPCRFSLGPSDEIYPETVVPRSQGRLLARCEGGVLDVLDTSGAAVDSFLGACSATWTPDGRLTFVNDGAVFVVSEPGREPERLYSRNQVGELLGRPSAVEEVAWVRDGQLWAAVRSGEAATLALLTRGQLAMSPSFTTRTIEGLRVSTTGIVAARTDRGVVFFDNGGRRALTFPNGRAVAWAPDHVIAAVATPDAIMLVAPISGEVVSLPVSVRDLEWVVP